MEYFDFDLDIQQAPENQYLVAVRSPAGEAQETVTLAYDALTLDNRLKDVEIALLQAGSRHRRVLQPAEQTVQRFGAELFDLLLTGNIRNRYDVSLAQAQQQQRGLRLRLCCDAPALAALPWEFLYDARRGDPVCLSHDTPLVRYLRLAQPVVPLRVAPPLRILAMAVSPSDLPALDLAAERQRMASALQPLQARGLVEVVWLQGQSWRDLRNALLDAGPWHIFHFIGHGGFDSRRDEGLLVFADAQGRAQGQTATNVGHLLADHKSLRLALLNACEGARGGQDIFSSTAATLVRRGIPAVIAMQYPITDEAAIQFAQEFYGQLAAGRPIDGAVAEARLAMVMENPHSQEWGTPVLYTHAADGRIFDVALSKEKAQAVAAVLAHPEPEPLRAAAPVQPLLSAPIPQRSPFRYARVMGVLLLLIMIGFSVWGIQYFKNELTARTVAEMTMLTRTTPAPAIGLAKIVTSTPRPTATRVPTPTPTYSEERIYFDRGTTSATRGGTVFPRQRNCYVLDALAGQQMTVQISSSNNRAYFMVSESAKGPISEWVGNKERSWTGKLPTTADYLICVATGSASVDYALKITISAL
ncbi:MAG: CHAT domain-containing protein [Caldilineaceae bacterium]